MKRPKSVLAIAVAKGVLAWVFVVDGEIKDWKTWRKCVSDPVQARSRLREVVAKYDPDTIVTEDPDRNCAKSGKPLRLLRVIAQDAADQPGHHVRVVRTQHDKTKYEEASELAAVYAEVAALLPNRPNSYRREERRMIVFEALALAVSIERWNT